MLERAACRRAHRRDRPGAPAAAGGRARGEALSSGGLVAFPTDTYYGIGCDLFDKRAIERIYQLKQLPRTHELSFICADLAEVSRYAIVDNAAYRVLRRKTPGPFTFVLPATRLVPDLVLRRQKTVGVRLPDSPSRSRSCRRLAHPLVSTSAATPDGEVLIDAQGHQGPARPRARAHPRRRLPAQRAVVGRRPHRPRAGGGASGQGRRLDLLL